MIRGKLSNSMVCEIGAACMKMKVFCKIADNHNASTWRSEKPHYHEDVWDKTVTEVISFIIRKL